MSWKDTISEMRPEQLRVSIAVILIALLLLLLLASCAIQGITSTFTGFTNSLK